LAGTRADPAGEVGPAESEADAGRRPSYRQVHAGDAGVCTVRPEDRQVKRAGWFYVGIAPLADEEFHILSSAERLADIGSPLHCISLPWPSAFFRRSTRERGGGFAGDSPLEGDGFELPVPRQRRHPSPTAG
jgi:hypothetical protein